MFKSRTEKLLLLARNRPNEESNDTELKSVSIRPIIDLTSKTRPIEKENIVELEEDESQTFTINASASTDQIGLGPIDCLPTEITDRKPVGQVSVRPMPSSSRSNVMDTFESEEESPNVSDNISASTSRLIDECLAENFLSASDDVFTIAHIPFENVTNTINDTGPPDINFCKQGFTCYHCNLVFPNKKDVRNHIVHIHMQTTVSSRPNDERIDSESINELVLTHQPPKKKVKNDDRDTTLKKRRDKTKLRITGKSYKNSKGKTIQEKKGKNVSVNAPLSAMRCSQMKIKIIFFQVIGKWQKRIAVRTGKDST